MLNTSSTVAPGRAEPFKCRERLLPRVAVQQTVAMSRSSLYRLIAEGSFPAPVYVGKKRVAWLESEVMQWIDARTEERNKKGSLNA
ncbi:hypothetical protein FACS189475_02170 [Betaproteobacteria bacterium]|nr:hypothetical protein FACS189475_02170 [Betaproteobacteria bacterium]